MSNLYNLISKMHCPSMVAIRTAWEQDLDQTFTDDTRLDSWLDTLLLHVCSACTLKQFIVVHRIHRSKTKLARTHPNMDPTCEKCKSAPASLLHMHWTCPSLITFGTSVFQTISGTLCHQIEANPFWLPSLTLFQIRICWKQNWMCWLLIRCWLNELSYVSGRILLLLPIHTG